MAFPGRLLMALLARAGADCSVGGTGSPAGLRKPSADFLASAMAEFLDQLLIIALYSNRYAMASPVTGP